MRLRMSSNNRLDAGRRTDAEETTSPTRSPGHLSRSCYGEWVTKDHIFSYVYGILHSPDYRERYARRSRQAMLPRIPEVATADAFRAFSEAGQRLLDLHIGYEAAAPYPLEERLAPRASRWARTLSGAEDALGGLRRRLQIVRQSSTTTGSRSQAYPMKPTDYVVGPRSALEWLLDRYRVTTDKDSGIVNDPNDWGSEIGEPRYIIDLVKPRHDCQRGKQWRL